MTLQPVILEGRLIRLEPLTANHIPDLLYAARDERIWHYMFYGNLAEREPMEAFINNAIRLRDLGTDLPFAVIHNATDKAIGSTRFRDICLKHMKLEIGGTWYASEYQRSGVNLECKYLLMRHAFETFGTLRVQFKTDIRNVRSRQSLEKLGAVQEGVLRRSAIMPDGLVRDTAVYSILDTEWGMVKQGLEMRMWRYANRSAAQKPADKTPATFPPVPYATK
ncbi:GNAT family N-acetyltransferase [Thiothrix subterranea]|uniref:GNAT family protein n=1 Tax=Thiothrix subterranea TaxID=2735563 RepID=A0AA51MIQ2_9GAMM|nr:GNAT family protein [Thiothrix subterranea]MDQ5768041.1 GNAT family protein [Thiothrix subterranea]WML85197.1 GNAT family protein [Thiothrix subterranea]